MKNYKIFSLIAIAGTIFLVSCKKDRVCECTTTVTFMGISETETSKTTFTDASKRTAKDACVSRKIEEDGFSGKADCKLK